LKSHYPCPPCFVAGKVRTGEVRKGEPGVMFHCGGSPQYARYECVCGAKLLIPIKEDR